MRNRWNGIPVFPIPIVWDAAGVPLSDIEYMETANRWHGVWHRFPPHNAGTCPGNTPGLDSSFGQVCSRPTTFSGEEFLRFHRDLLDTYDEWRHRAGMPTVERWKPPGLHFHPDPQIPEIPSPAGLELDEDPTVQYGQIKDVVKHFNTVEALGEYAEGALHGAGHGAPESDDIGDAFTNNYRHALHVRADRAPVPPGFALRAYRHTQTEPRGRIEVVGRCILRVFRPRSVMSTLPAAKLPRGRATVRP